MRVLSCEPALRARSAENTTSSAVKGEPSWNFTPLRRWKRQRVGLEHLPALGEARDDLQVLVALDQALHHVGERAEREGLVERVGVERVQTALEGELEGFRRLAVGVRARCKPSQWQRQQRREWQRPAARMLAGGASSAKRRADRMPEGYARIGEQMPTGVPPAARPCVQATVPDGLDPKRRGRLVQA